MALSVKHKLIWAQPISAGQSAAAAATKRNADLFAISLVAVAAALSDAIDGVLSVVDMLRRRNTCICVAMNAEFGVLA